MGKPSWFTKLRWRLYRVEVKCVRALVLTLSAIQSWVLQRLEHDFGLHNGITIYVVVGMHNPDTNLYAPDELGVWPVRAFLDLGSAERHAEQAQRRTLEIKAEQRGLLGTDLVEAQQRMINEFDPLMDQDYADIVYRVWDAEVGHG